MSSIVIDKWYGKEKTDLINKNTFDKVEFMETSTGVVGGELYSKELWFWGNISEQDFLDAGFDSITMRNNTGRNEHTPWSDYIRTNPTEKLGDGIITFPNVYGDNNKENYAVTVKSCFIDEARTSFYTYEFLKGSFVTPSDKESTSITGDIDITFSGDNVILALKDMLLYGDYYVGFNEQTEFDETRRLTPWYWRVKVVYGGLKTTKEKLEYGTGDNSYSFSENSLIEEHATVSGKKLSEKLAEDIMATYKNGRQTISLTICGDKFYDTDGNLCVDINSIDDSVANLIKVGDCITLKKLGEYLYKKPNGEPKEFLVTKANLIFKGKPKITIEGVEII